MASRNSLNASSAFPFRKSRLPLKLWASGDFGSAWTAASICRRAGVLFALAYRDAPLRFRVLPAVDAARLFEGALEGSLDPG